MGVDPGPIARGLSGRLADVEQAVHRYGSFAHRPGTEPAPDAAVPRERDAAARDLVLRSLATFADPVNQAVLGRLGEGDAPLSDLMALVGLPRPAVWERINDLRQVGLVGHALDEDTVGLSAAGAAMMGLVDTVVAEMGGEAAGVEP